MESMRRSRSDLWGGGGETAPPAAASSPPEEDDLPSMTAPLSAGDNESSTTDAVNWRTPNGGGETLPLTGPWRGGLAADSATGEDGAEEKEPVGEAEGAVAARGGAGNRLERGWWPVGEAPEEMDAAAAAAAAE